MRLCACSTGVRVAMAPALASQLAPSNTRRPSDSEKLRTRLLLLSVRPELPRRGHAGAIAGARIGDHAKHNGGRALTARPR